MEYRGKLSWPRLSEHFGVKLDGLRKILSISLTLTCCWIEFERAAFRIGINGVIAMQIISGVTCLVANFTQKVYHWGDFFLKFKEILESYIRGRHDSTHIMISMDRRVIINDGKKISRGNFLPT
jgi:hypothetical protein